MNTMPSPIDRVLAALRERGHEPKPSGSEFICRCPAHDDRNPSLSFKEGSEGQVLLHCHTGCSVEDVCRALGLSMADLFPSNGSSKATQENGYKDAKQGERRARAAQLASAIVDAAHPSQKDHPYLLRKGVKPTETLLEISIEQAVDILGYHPRSNDELLTGHQLVVPVETNGEISTIEFIDEDGRKSALAGGKKGGGFWVAQPLPESNGAGLVIAIGEGVATALTVKEATGHLVVATLSGGNLPAVAKALRELYPAATLVVLADLAKITGEPDVHAVEAAQAISGLLAIPKFGANRPEGATDFNDLSKHLNFDAVVSAVNNAMEADGVVPPITWTFVGRKQNATNFALSILRNDLLQKVVSGKIGDPETAINEAIQLTNPSAEEAIRKALGDMVQGKKPPKQPSNFAYTEQGLALGEERLCTHNMRIVEEIELDDLSGQLTKQLKLKVWQGSAREPEDNDSKFVTLDSHRFESMDWLIDEVGADAFVYSGSGIRDMLRHGVQDLSAAKGIQKRREITATGWAKADGEPVFVTCSGAITKDGLNKALAASLPEQLRRYELPEPPIGDRLKDAINAALTYTRISPHLWLGVSLLTLPFRAVLGSVDLSGQLTASTGSYKTSIAANLLHFFGRRWSPQGLVGFESTANASEAISYTAKDVLLVIDDYVPGEGNRHRKQEMATRLIRGTANQAGRMRANRDGTLSDRNQYPRCLPLITAEEGQETGSIMARVWEVSFRKQDINRENLTKVQQLGKEGVLAECMAGFVHWLIKSGKHRGIREQVDTREREMFSELKVAHDRTRRNAAEMLITLELFLEFANQAGAFESVEILDNLKVKITKAVHDHAKTHAGGVREASDANRFVECIRESLKAGGCHLSNQDGSVPNSFSTFGWRKMGTVVDPFGQGPCIGFIKFDKKEEGKEKGESYVYLLPTTALAVAKKAARAADLRMEFGRTAVMQQLLEQGFIVPFIRKERGKLRPEHRRRFCGSNEDVLKMPLKTLLPGFGEEEEERNPGRDGEVPF